MISAFPFSPHYTMYLAVEKHDHVVCARVWGEGFKNAFLPPCACTYGKAQHEAKAAGGKEETHSCPLNRPAKGTSSRPYDHPLIHVENVESCGVLFGSGKIKERLKKRRRKDSAEITINFFTAGWWRCLGHVFFISPSAPNWRCFKIEWLAVKTCLLQAEKKNAGVCASKLIALCTQLTAAVTLSDW